MKLVIDRERWQRGNSNMAQLLHETTGKMCCLGFFALACGYTKEQINGRGEPYEVADEDTRRGDLHKWPSWGIKKFKLGSAGNSAAFEELMGINDDNTIDENTREAKIEEVFARYGVTVEFID